MRAFTTISGITRGAHREKPVTVFDLSYIRTWELRMINFAACETPRMFQFHKSYVRRARVDCKQGATTETKLSAVFFFL